VYKIIDFGLGRFDEYYAADEVDICKIEMYSLKPLAAISVLLLTVQTSSNSETLAMLASQSSAAGRVLRQHCYRVQLAAQVGRADTMSPVSLCNGVASCSNAVCGGPEAVSRKHVLQAWPCSL
jgi:hypothetical protein